MKRLWFGLAVFFAVMTTGMVSHAQSVLWVVRPGDSLCRIAVEINRQCGPKILGALFRANPQLAEPAARALFRGDANVVIYPRDIIRIPLKENGSAISVEFPALTENEKSLFAMVDEAARVNDKLLKANRDLKSGLISALVGAGILIFILFTILWLHAREPKRKDA